MNMYPFVAQIEQLQVVTTCVGSSSGGEIVTAYFTAPQWQPPLYVFEGLPSMNGTVRIGPWSVSLRGYEDPRRLNCFEWRGGLRNSASRTDFILIFHVYIYVLLNKGNRVHPSSRLHTTPANRESLRPASALASCHFVYAKSGA